MRLTSGTLPDVSQFRALVGNKGLLMFWIALSWSLAAFVEEAAYRGWILTRCAELGGYSRGAWVGGMVVRCLSRDGAESVGRYHRARIVGHDRLRADVLRRLPGTLISDGSAEIQRAESFRVG